MIGERPQFLDRYLGDYSRTRKRRKQWRQTPLMKNHAKKDALKREKIAARPVVYAAVKAGAETFQAIRTATGLDPVYILAALRFYINTARAIRKDGRRYYAER